MIEVFCTDKDGNLVERLTQWDVDQYILIGGSGLTEAPKIHFCNTCSKEALVVESVIENDAVKAKIPNILLQEGLLIIAYLYVYAPDVSTVSAKTKATIRIPVRPRPKPSNYPYIENVDYISAVKLEEKIKNEIDSLSGEYEQAIDRIEADYTSAKANLEAEYADAKSNLETEYSEAISKYNTAVVDYENLSENLAKEYSETTASLETKYAETEKTLSDNYDLTITKLKNQSDNLANDYSETTTNLEAEFDKTVDSLIAKFADGSPKGIFASETDLTDKDAGIYLNTNDGWIYYWDGTNLSQGVCRYQSTVIWNGGLTWGQLKDGFIS